MTEQDHPITPEEEKRIDKLVDSGKMDYAMARAAVRGYFDDSQSELGDGPDESQHDAPEPDEAPLPDPHRRVSPHHVKGGHVRDFADGGRADEYRGGDFGEPQTEEDRQARADALPDLQEVRDDNIKAKLMGLLGEGYTHEEIQALWEAGEQRRGHRSDQNKSE